MHDWTVAIDCMDVMVIWCYEMTQTVFVIHLIICRSAYWVCLVLLVLIDNSFTKGCI